MTIVDPAASGITSAAFLPTYPMAAIVLSPK